MSFFQDAPSYSRQVQSFTEFCKNAERMAHFAFKRSGYYHHFIVTRWKNVKKTIWEYYVCFSNMITGQGEVKERSVNENEIKQAIKEKKLYIIEAPNYPKTDKEKTKAHERFWNRRGEKEYTLGSNNCEHMVSYVMTGSPFSEQIKKAGAWKKLFIDTFDNSISHGKRNALKRSGCLIVCFPVKRYVDIAANKVRNEAKISLGLSPNFLNRNPFPVDRATENMCK